MHLKNDGILDRLEVFLKLSIQIAQPMMQERYED